MRQLLAFFIFITFLTQTFSKAFIVAGYYTNTASFAKNCENKNKPAMHCNGKCQMIKKLRQDENKDTQNSNRRADDTNEVLSSKSFFPIIQIVVTPFKISYPIIKASVAIDHTYDFFHPPQV